jgi:subfamily B ATP-binding cassette protein HlyB/CyaB
MEPQLERATAAISPSTSAAGFATRQVGNTYNVLANGLEQVMTLAILVVGACW